MGRLDGKVVAITGAARGLGKEYALSLSKEGASVALMDTDAKVNDTLSAITDGNGRSLSFVGDVSQMTDADKFAKRTHKTFGRIDVLINNAAVFAELTNKPFTKIQEDEWDKVMNVNIKGVWMMTKAVVPYMIEARKGKIINVSSSTFFNGAPGMLHYIASKGAVIGMTRATATELGKYGIRVNCIAPGLTRTEAAMGITPKERINALTRENPLRRIAEPSDLVGPIIFLCSDESNHMTGQTILVDGGNRYL